MITRYFTQAANVAPAASSNQQDLSIVGFANAVFRSSIISKLLHSYFLLPTYSDTNSCIFINNCVGYGNQHWFLLLLFTTAVLTSYATYVGTSLLSSLIQQHIPRWTLTGRGFSWSEHFDILAWALQEKTRMGAVTLLCLLTSPLIWGLLGYHLYLIWAGTTTNESMKWSDWEAEMSDGFVFKRKLPEDRQKDPSIEPAWTPWPADSTQIIFRTEDGLPPRGPDAIGVGEWERVWKLADIENLYDLGWKDNLVDVFLPRSKSRYPKAESF